MKLLISSLLLLAGIAGMAHAGEAALPPGPCIVGFQAKGAPTEANYLCSEPALTCRKDWFVGGADSGVSRFSSYLCKPDMTRMSAMVGITPATCSGGFHPRPPGVRNGQSYGCEAVQAIIAPQCLSGYTAGALTLAGRPLGYASGTAAATRRQLDGASISYVCTKQ
jgi:hypothetical protein